jgi:hypothetical protein
MTTPNRYHKLKAYSLFSTAFLINGPSGFNQVVYVDIDPDIILDTPGEQFTLDIDGNGSDDISFLIPPLIFLWLPLGGRIGQDKI